VLGGFGGALGEFEGCWVEVEARVSGVTWSAPKVLTQGLMPPVPRAMMYIMDTKKGTVLRAAIPLDRTSPTSP
jgi:hypothetical protein